MENKKLAFILRIGQGFLNSQKHDEQLRREIEVGLIYIKIYIYSFFQTEDTIIYRKIIKEIYKYYWTKTIITK